MSGPGEPVPLTEADIHVCRDSIGANGRAKHERIWRVYVGHHAALDARGRQRSFTKHRSAHAAGVALLAQLNARQVETRRA